MNYYNVKYLKNGTPQGRPYAFKTELELSEGDTVELEGGKHGQVVGLADMEMVNQYGADKMKSIVGCVRILKDFIGKIFKEVEKVGEDELHFIFRDGKKYVFYHEQDCCESVYIEDISGELKDLIGTPITMAEEVKHSRVADNFCDDGCTYTFYKFATVKGYVTVRWCGSSNGFYSESVDFREEREDK